MQTDIKIPAYLTEQFSLFLENMASLSDPENPSLLQNYLVSSFEQLQQSPLMFADMIDQLAMAISTKVRVDSKKLAELDLSTEPQWESVKACVGVHAQARACITEIMENAEHNLKIAVLLLHFYSIYDATPLNAEDELDDFEDEFESNNYDFDNEYDENY